MAIFWVLHFKRLRLGEERKKEEEEQTTA